MPGQVVWVDFSPVRGREQDGHRPALVISGSNFLSLATTLVSVLPITTVDRGWPNHVLIGSALAQDSWAMTEQIRTISRERITRTGKTVSADTLTEIRHWIIDLLDLDA